MHVIFPNWDHAYRLIRRVRCASPDSVRVSGNQYRYHYGKDWGRGLPGAVGNKVVGKG